MRGGEPWILTRDSRVRRARLRDGPPQCALCEEFIFDNGLMEHVVNKSQSEIFECKHKEPRLHGAPSRACSVARIAGVRSRLTGGGDASGCVRTITTGMLDGFVKIFRHEGVRGLYSGLTPTLIMAVPSVVTYFTLYDWLRDRMGRWKHLGDVSAPLVAGSVARTIAATLIAPLELVRTQHQAAKRGKSGSMIDSIQKNSHPSHGGLRSLWRGLGPTLWRDVPFSGLYWLGYEQLRALLAKPGVQETQAMGAFKSFVAGACSGMMAAVLTHPFDVAKTRAQVLILASHSSKAAASGSAVARSSAPSTAALLREIMRTEGLQGLYAGVFPRLTKVAPSCAIMISAYEAGKELYRRQAAKHGSSRAWM